MALTVNTNVSALNAQRSTLDSQNEMASAMERLASGKRINSARDDAAGLAITARMESQISGLNQAVRNANDAISLVQTAEGALQETTDILQRIRELAIQSAGGAPSNADRVNLNKEVVQLQEELSRIANTTRFNGGLLLNGSFVDTDFQIGQSNNEEITVTVGDVRPERIGAYTQSTLDNVGYVTQGASLEEIDNGVNQQVLIVQVGNEVPRTVEINKGDDTRTISDKLNQAGAQINTTAITENNIYIGGAGSFSFKISSSATPDIQDVVTVGATAGSQAATLAAQINSGYSEHNISAELMVDDDGVEYVKMTQDNGYDVMVEQFVTTGSSTIDFSGDGNPELTGAYGETAAIIGGRITIDAPQSFLISSDDESNTILAGTRASMEIVGVQNDPSEYQDKEFDVTVNGVTKTITLAAPPPAEPTPALSAIAEMSFVAEPQEPTTAAAQIGAFRANTHLVGTVTTRTGEDIGDGTTQLAVNVNGKGFQDLDIAQSLTNAGIESGDRITGQQFVDALQSTLNKNGLFSGDDAITVSLTDAGQIQLDVAGGAGSIAVREHSTQRDGITKTLLTSDIDLDEDSLTLTNHGLTTGMAVTYAATSTTASDAMGFLDGTSANTAMPSPAYVIRVDDDTIQFASSLADAQAGTQLDLDRNGNDAQTITLSASNGLGANLLKSTTPTGADVGKASESGTGGSLILGASVNGDRDGPVAPFGVDAFVIEDDTELTVASISTSADTVTMSAAHGLETGQKLSYSSVGTTAGGFSALTLAEDYYVIEGTSATSLKLATSYADAINGNAVDLTSTSAGDEVFTFNNDTFTLSIDDGALTTLEIPDGTYYSVEEMVDAVQGAIDDSPFASTGRYPINASVTTDALGDKGIEFSSADGFSITLGGTEFLTDAKALGIQGTIQAPDVGALDERLYTVNVGTTANSGVYDDVVSDQTTKFALSVNDSAYIDFDLHTYLDDLDISSTTAGGTATVTETQFVSAMQDAIDANEYFSGDNAVTVTTTDEGLIQLEVAGGKGSITMVEHSDSVTAGTNGLVNTLTKAYENQDHIGRAISNGGAFESSENGTLVLGATSNAAILSDNLDASDANFVKPFGIAPLEITSSNNTLDLTINETTSITGLQVAAGVYTTPTAFAEAVQLAINSSPQLDQADWTVNVEALRDDDTSTWGLKLSSPQGYKIEYSGTLITDSGALNAAAGSVAAVTEAPKGPAATRSTVDSGAMALGINLSTDPEDGTPLNLVTIEVIDNETGAMSTREVALGSTEESVSFAEYMSFLEAAANTAFVEEGYTFQATGEGSAYSMSFEPAGDYTVSFAGTSIEQAFGGPVSATGTPSNIDGVTFTSMDDVVAQMNAQFEANDLEVQASYKRGGDTFTFAVTGGRADATSGLTLAGDDLVDLGFTGSLTAIGGGTHKAEDVRYVSQIDISTREEALLSMTVVDAALETIAGIRGGLGAVANRLDSTISNLLNIAENTAASMSRVMDADFAAESTRLARAQVLQQAAVAMLAQANASSQNVLKLLQ